jgi:hypothetical protein
MDRLEEMDLETVLEMEVEVETLELEEPLEQEIMRLVAVAAVGLVVAAVAHMELLVEQVQPDQTPEMVEIQVRQISEGEVETSGPQGLLDLRTAQVTLRPTSGQALPFGDVAGAEVQQGLVPALGDLAGLRQVEPGLDVQELLADVPQRRQGRGRPVLLGGVDGPAHLAVVGQAAGQADGPDGVEPVGVLHDGLRQRPGRLVLKKNGLLTRDDRKKERKKPGLRRARRAPQWAKR